MLKHWNKLPGEAVDDLSVEAFKARLDGEAWKRVQWCETSAMSLWLIQQWCHLRNVSEARPLLRKQKHSGFHLVPQLQVLIGNLWYWLKTGHLPWWLPFWVRRGKSKNIQSSSVDRWQEGISISGRRSCSLLTSDLLFLRHQKKIMQDIMPPTIDIFIFCPVH